MAPKVTPALVFGLEKSSSSAVLKLITFAAERDGPPKKKGRRKEVKHFSRRNSSEIFECLPLFSETEKTSVFPQTSLKKVKRKNKKKYKS